MSPAARFDLEVARANRVAFSFSVLFCGRADAAFLSFLRSSKICSASSAIKMQSAASASSISSWFIICSYFVRLSNSIPHITSSGSVSVLFSQRRSRNKIVRIVTWSVDLALHPIPHRETMIAYCFQKTDKTSYDYAWVNN
uniref:Putative secreted protein n=1 Tax=Ixodes ricinus TaxID=34613 RepID=A0A6B0UUQ9_IXORI